MPSLIETGSGPQASSLVRNPVLAVLAAVGIAAAATMPIVTHAPNRLLSGSPVGWGEIVAGGGLLAFLPALPLLAAPFLPERRWLSAIVAGAGSLFAATLLLLAGAIAVRLAGVPSPSARTSFGGAFWVLEAVAMLAAANAVQRSGARAGWSIVLGVALVLPLAAVIASGAADQLSIMKEYANRRDVFASAVGTHLAIVGAMLVPTLAIGLPLGLLLHRRKTSAPSVFALLNIVQTIPSIALFGLLIGPLAALVAALPALGRLGISGIGITPAIIALTLYSLLPITRSTVAGLAAVPESAVEAARGIGMTRGEIFRSVEVPLALPILVAGLRVTIVQAIGLTAVAALIGAGGLGTFIFQGLNGSAIDLVLLGVVPLVAITIAADLLLRLVALIVRGQGA